MFEIIQKIRRSFGLAYVASLLVVLCWGLWLVIVFGVVLAKLPFEEIVEIVDLVQPYVLKYIFAISSLSFVAYLVMHLPVCSICKKKLFDEPKHPHHNFSPSKWFGGRADIMVRVVRHKKLICMHCGNDFDSC